MDDIYGIVVLSLLGLVLAVAALALLALAGVAYAHFIVWAWGLSY